MTTIKKYDNRKYYQVGKGLINLGEISKLPELGELRVINSLQEDITEITLMKSRHINELKEFNNG